MLAVDGREKGLCVFEDFFSFTFPLFLDGIAMTFITSGGKPNLYWGSRVPKLPAQLLLCVHTSPHPAPNLQTRTLFPLDPGLAGDALSKRVRQKQHGARVGTGRPEPSLAEAGHRRRLQLPWNPARSWL